MPAFLIPLLLKYVLPAVVIVSVLLGIRSHFINIGKELERAEWIQELDKQKAESFKKLNDKRKEYELKERGYQLLVAKLQDVHNEKTQKLNDDINTLSNRGLFITAKKCPATDNLPGDRTDGNTIDLGSGTDRVRLHESDENNLISLARDAQQVVQQYQACRALILAKPECYAVARLVDVER